MRERLIEILREARNKCDKTKKCIDCVWHDKGGECFWYLYTDQLIAEGVIVPPKIVYCIVNKGTPYAFVAGKCPDFMQLYELKDLKKNGYYLTKEEAKQALAEGRKR